MGTDFSKCHDGPQCLSYFTFVSLQFSLYVQSSAKYNSLDELISS